MPKRPHVALLVESSNKYAREMLHGVRAFIRKHRSWFIQIDEQSRGDRPPGWLTTWKGHGIIARVENEAIASEVCAVGVPLVDVSAGRLLSHVPCVTTDNAAIARLAARHLMERGFKHFGYCGVHGLKWSERRAEYFRGVVESAGHECHVYPGAPCARPSAWNHDLDAVSAWMKRLPKPVGVMAAWDGCGTQLLELCRTLGFAVPEEVAVIGVDNDELLCDLADPALTSVATDPYRTGYLAASLLERMMLGEEVSPDVFLVPPVGIQARMSTEGFAIEDHAVKEAVQFIRENACTGIKVADVVERVPLSRRVLETRFKRLVGRTPHEQILWLKLERVKELLAETDLSQAEIAERCGFKHVEYMSVVFRKRYGQAPGDYRVERQV